MAKTWGDVFNAAKRRGEDPSYAAFLADEWEKRKMKPKPEPPKATCPKCGKPVSIGGDGRLVTHGPSSTGKMTCPGSWGTPETGKP